MKSLPEYQNIVRFQAKQYTPDDFTELPQGTDDGVGRQIDISAWLYIDLPVHERCIIPLA
jgi:hypothetical protein